MPDEPYTLGDLASLADVTPRTIRYYVAQGLLPSPEAAGPATRYGEGHLLRLRLIRRLQRDHLPLAEIRARLERMDDDEVAQALDATPSAPPPPAETLAFVQDLMARSGLQSRRSTTSGALLRETRATFEPSIPDAYPLRSEPAPPMPAMAPPPLLPDPLGPRTPPDRSTWERHVITADVEVHVRRPLDRVSNKKVEHFLRIARELFTDER